MVSDFTRAFLNRLGLVAAAALAAAGTFGALSFFDQAIGDHAYRWMGFDQTFRPKEYYESSFVWKEFINYTMSDGVCEKYHKQILILGSSETSGNYEPYAYSPTAYLNQKLPSDMIAFNLSVAGYFLHNQAVLQGYLLRHLNPRCHPVFIYAINPRTFAIDLSVKSLDFFGNHEGPYAVSENHTRKNQRLVFSQFMPNVIGLLQFLAHPLQTNERMALPRALWDRSLDADHFYYFNGRPGYTQTKRWYENVPPSECADGDVSAQILKGREREILDYLIASFAAAGLKYNFYLHPSRVFPAADCGKMRNSIATFDRIFPQAWRISPDDFGRDDYADGWHLTEKGNEKMADEWLSFLKKNAEI